MKILDLNYVDTSMFSKDLQKNINIIKQKFGKTFIIKDGDIKLPSLIYTVTNKYNKNFTYYALIYDDPKIDRTSWLLPFKIDFIDNSKVLQIYNSDDTHQNSDNINKAKNNNCYIANIHKTDTVSGTNMVTALLKLLKMINAENVELHDGTRVTCPTAGEHNEIDLSFFKLLERGITFYQKFGFKFVLNSGEPYYITDFGTTSNMTRVLQQSLEKFRKIKISYYKDAYIKILDIITDVIKNQDYDNVTVYNYHRIKPYAKNKQQIKDYLMNLVTMINDLLAIVKSTKKIYLVDVLIEKFYESCNLYLKLEDIIMRNMLYGVVYKNKAVYLKHIDIIDTIYTIRQSSIFRIKLN